MKLYTLALLATVATVAVAQTPAPKPTDFPKVVSAQLILDSTEATQPGNEWIKPCGPSNHDDACFTQNPAPAPKPAQPYTTLSDGPLLSYSTAPVTFNSISNTTKEGCSPSFGNWDAKRKLCEGVIEFNFNEMGQVSCSRGRKRRESWVVTCWYKPNVPPRAKGLR